LLGDRRRAAGQGYGRTVLYCGRVFSSTRLDKWICRYMTQVQDQPYYLEHVCVPQVLRFRFCWLLFSSIFVGTTHL
jgi:hypothetical protein